MSSKFQHLLNIFGCSRYGYISLNHLISGFQHQWQSTRMAWDICNNEDTIRSMDISYSLQQLNLSKKCYESNWYVSCNTPWIWCLSLLFNLTCQFLSTLITSELTISFTSCFVRGSSSAFCSLTAEETER